MISDIFFFNDTATTEIYTLSLHDALPILQPSARWGRRWRCSPTPSSQPFCPPARRKVDRKSTRLNSSHLVISYAVFCLKKKKRDDLGLTVLTYYPYRSSEVCVRIARVTSI